jgi:hypothetical protein
MRAINWTLGLLEKDPRPKSGTLKLLNLHGTILKGKSIGSDQKKELKRELLLWFVRIWTLKPQLKWA